MTERGKASKRTSPPALRTAASSARAEPDADLTVGVEDLIVAGSDAAFRDVMADLFAAASSMQAVRRALGRATGLSGSDIAILLAIRRLSAGGSVSVKAIADHLDVAAPHATTEIGKLEASGLVTKEVNARDGRSVDVKLTPKGLSRLRQLTPLVRRVNDVLFQGMSAEEMHHVARFLKRIVATSAEASRRIAQDDVG